MTIDQLLNRLTLPGGVHYVMLSPLFDNPLRGPRADTGLRVTLLRMTIYFSVKTEFL